MPIGQFFFTDFTIDTIVRVDLHANQRVTGTWFHKNRNRADIFAESPIVLHHKGQEDADCIICDIAEDESVQFPTGTQHHLLVSQNQVSGDDHGQ